MGPSPNNHVLAGVDGGRPGDAILQPGKADGGRRLEDQIGSLYRAIPISFNPEVPNFVDCAVATILKDVNYISDRICNPKNDWTLPLTGDVRTEITEGEQVLKVGRTTGLTDGEIVATEVDQIVVNMGSAQNPRYARFDGQISIHSDGRQFSKGGDSGSLIVDPAGNGCGLLFAGSERYEKSPYGITFANPLGNVLSELGADFYVG